jgi:hypothetical protein
MEINNKINLMSFKEKYIEQNKISFDIFNKLFELKKDDFIKVMKYIFKDNKDILQLLEKGNIIKTIIDDKPDSIVINFYDEIVINCSGIYYNPEYGIPNVILKCNEFFNIEDALNTLNN